MDDTPGRVGTGGSDEVEERTRDIREEIEETRSEMSETIDAIQEKLKPSNIVAHATDRVKSATTERVRDMADTARETAQQTMEYTREAASSAADAARQNPIPLALAGITAAWWLTNRSNRSRALHRNRDEYGYDRGGYRGYDHDDTGTGGMLERIRANPGAATLVGAGLAWLAMSPGERQYRSDGGTTSRGLTDRADELSSRTRQYASETGESVRRMARRGRNQVEQMMDENPVLVGAGALLVGLAFGLAVPETETENQLMGETRDSVVERAQDVARTTANEVQEAASTVADAAKKITGSSPL